MRKNSTTKDRNVIRFDREQPEIPTATNAKGFTNTKRRWDTSQAKVRGLVESILVDEDNDQALALIALIELLVYESTELVDREALAGMAMNHAYTQTLAFGHAALAFRDLAVRQYR